MRIRMPMVCSRAKVQMWTPGNKGTRIVCVRLCGRGTRHGLVRDVLVALSSQPGGSPFEPCRVLAFMSTPADLTLFWSEVA